MDTIPINDLHKQYKVLEEEIQAAIKLAFESSNFILGPIVDDFEHRLEAYCQCSHAIGVASGTDALFLALAALGIGIGDEVITTPFTFGATSLSINRVGATPVFVDINTETFNIDVQKINSVITRKTKAILPVHLFGQPADMAPIWEIARAYSIYVIDDAAQAIGASYRGKKIGNLGDATILSFFPTKNLGAYGDGGAVLTNMDNLAEEIRILRHHGTTSKYIYDRAGINSRLDAVQAEILKVKLNYLDEWNKKRRIIARTYNENLTNANIILPIESPDSQHVYHQYTIRVPMHRDKLREYLSSLGIQTAIYYPLGMHMQRVYSYLGYREGSFPNTELCCRQVLSLPCFPELTEDQQWSVIRSINEFF